MRPKRSSAFDLSAAALGSTAKARPSTIPIQLAADGLVLPATAGGSVRVNLAPLANRRAADAPVRHAGRAPRPFGSARMMTPGPVVEDVVLVGAGHAHVAVLRRFGMRPLPGVRFTLIARDLHTPYSGMLPGLVAGLYGFDDAHIDTRPLARFAGARLYHDTAIGLDLVNKRVICRDRPSVPFDLLSLDMGSTPNTGFVPGAAEHAIPVKPISEFLPRLEALIARLRERRGRARVALVGAGAGGVELLLALERRLRGEAADAGCDPGGLAFTLVSGSDEILPAFPPAFRRRFERIFAERGR